MFQANDFEAVGSVPQGKRLAVWMAGLLLMLAGPVYQLHAQTNAGLTGTVTDSSGAAVAGARVTFTNEATGIRTQFATSSVGLYSASLPAGTYNVTVEAGGFMKFEETHVVVEVGAEATDNIQLTVGGGSQTVEVASSNSDELNTTNPQLDSMLQPQEVADLPLEINGNIRQIPSCATLAPGVRRITKFFMRTSFDISRAAKIYERNDCSTFNLPNGKMRTFYEKTDDAIIDSRFQPGRSEEHTSEL